VVDSADEFIVLRTSEDPELHQKAANDSARKKPGKKLLKDIQI
jgi:hypothetical protein